MHTNKANPNSSPVTAPVHCHDVGKHSHSSCLGRFDRPLHIAAGPSPHLWALEHWCLQAMFLQLWPHCYRPRTTPPFRAHVIWDRSFSENASELRRESSKWSWTTQDQAVNSSELYCTKGCSFKALTLATMKAIMRGNYDDSSCRPWVNKCHPNILT